MISLILHLYVGMELEHFESEVLPVLSFDFIEFSHRQPETKQRLLPWAIFLFMYCGANCVYAVVIFKVTRYKLGCRMLQERQFLG